MSPSWTVRVLGGVVPTIKLDGFALSVFIAPWRKLIKQYSFFMSREQICDSLSWRQFWKSVHRMPICIKILQWRHNGRDGVSNNQPHDCLFNRLFRHRSKKTSKPASLAFVRGIHRWPVNSPHKGPVTRKLVPFHDASLTDMFKISYLLFQ